MGKKDTITKNYLNDPCIFADAFNYLLYHGAQVVLPEKLLPLDTVEAAFPYGADGRLQPVQKFRKPPFLTAQTGDCSLYRNSGTTLNTWRLCRMRKRPISFWE